MPDYTEKHLWRLDPTEPEISPIPLPVWSYLCDPDEDPDYADHSLCEAQSDEDPCEGPMSITGVEFDTWIALCDKHLREGCTPVEQAEYDALIEGMLKEDK